MKERLQAKKSTVHAEKRGRKQPKKEKELVKTLVQFD